MTKQQPKRAPTGATLTQLIEAAGRPLADYQQALGYSRITWWNKRRDPSSWTLENMVRLAALLELPPDEVFAAIVRQLDPTRYQPVPEGFAATLEDLIKAARLMPIAYLEAFGFSNRSAWWHKRRNLPRWTVNDIFRLATVMHRSPAEIFAAIARQAYESGAAGEEN